MKEYSVREISELLEVSKPTVQKKIKELEIEPERTENNNRAYYNYADAEKVIKAIRPSFDFSVLEEVGAEPPNTAKPQNEAQNEPPNTAKPQSEAPSEAQSTAKPQSDELEFLRRTLAIIETQLAEKDKQLAVKDKQIQDLSDRLAEAIQLTKGQQYIAAADKTAGLLEADSKRGLKEEPAAEIDPEEPTKKKSIWKRLFGR